MIWDAHAHLKHGDAAGTEYTPEAIVRTMDGAGIERSVVFAISTTTRRSVQMAEDAVERFPQRLIPFAYALASDERPVLGELDQALSEKGFRGIKLHAGQCRLAPHLVDPVIAMAGRHGAPCLIDFCGDHAAAERLATTFPGTRIIIAHLGKYLCRDEGLLDRFLSIAEACANVCLDISGVVALHKIGDALERVGSERIVWGTDGPHEAPDTVGFARAELAKVAGLGLSRQEEADVLGLSLARLLRMGPTEGGGS